MTDQPAEPPTHDRRQADSAILSGLAEVRAQLLENSEATRGLSKSIDSLGRVTEMAARTARNAADQSSETATLVVHAADHADGERARLEADVADARRQAIDAATAARIVALQENAATRRALVRRGCTALALLAVAVIAGGLLVVHLGSAADRRQNVRAAQLLQQRNQTARTSCESRNAAAVASGEKLDAFFLGLEAIERRNKLNGELAGDRIAVYEKARRDFGQSAPLPDCARLYPDTHS